MIFVDVDTVPQKRIFLTQLTEPFDRLYDGLCSVR